MFDGRWTLGGGFNRDGATNYDWLNPFNHGSSGENPSEISKGDGYRIGGGYPSGPFITANRAG